MGIEVNIERIADALTRIADVMESRPPVDAPAEAEEEKAPAKKPAAKKPAKKAAPKKKAPEPDPAPEEDEEEAEAEEAEAEEAEAPDPLDDEEPAPKAKKVTKEMVRKALMDYRDLEGSPAMLSLLSENGNGASGISSLDEADYAAVHKAATTMLSK